MTLRQRAERWLVDDPDEVTRGELLALLDSGDTAALGACFEPPLVFGTAGLRGALGPGPARMNRAVVRRVSFGLAAFLKEEGLADRPVVVGFDARAMSREFALETRQVLLAQGLFVQFFPEPCPTPFVAFACRELGAAAGVVVTASHNPRGDSGYKVYDDRGIQIVAPWDRRIAELAEEAPPPAQIPLREQGAAPVPADIVDAYFAAWQTISDPEPRLRVAYTPLHGVGLAAQRRALVASGRVELRVVAEQAAPDGSFPTAAFPNPEEPGVVDRLIELARRERCDLALANDPDADRLAVCLPEGDTWRRLSGDEVGVLLADHLLRQDTGSHAERLVLASSVVSSPWLDGVAEAYGARVERTLTGFKWLCRVPAYLPEGERLLFAYEEALGYAVDPRVLDKDGISAALCFVDLARALKRQESSVAERLEELQGRFGYWMSHPESVRLEGTDAQARMTAALARLRQAPPDRVAELPVLGSTDYLAGAEHRAPYLGSQDLVALDLGAGGSGAVQEGRVLIRPSGTEPKIKLYVHLRGAPDHPNRAAQREELGLEGERIVADLVRRCGLL